MKQNILIAILLGCGIQMMQAQTSAKDTALQRMMILEKEYNPTIEKASKINTLPEVKEPQATQAKIEYSNYSTPVSLKPEPSQVDAAQYFKDLGSSNNRGYLRAGVSTFVDIDGDAGYQILNSKSDDLSVWLTHRSSSGKVKSLQTNEKMEHKLNDNTGAFRYSHSFEESKLFADAKYTYSCFNYYNGGLSNAESFPTQTNNIFDANLGSLLKDILVFDLFLGLNYTHFGQKESLLPGIKGPEENRLKVDFDVFMGFDNDKLIGIAGFLRSDFYSVPDTASYFYKDCGDLALNPYFKMEGDNWKMRLGAFTHLLFNQTKKIFFTPDIELSFRPHESGLLYLTAKGEVADNSNSKIFYENRYILPLARVLDSYTQFDGTAGFKTSLSRVFDADFYAGYKIIKQEHFYRPDSVPGLGSDIWGAFSPDYYNTQVFKLGTNLRYQYGKMFDLSLRAVYYNWEVDAPGKKAWNKPDFTSDLTAGFQIQTIPLRFDLAYHLETGRKSFLKNNIVNMENINDVNFTGTYSFNNSFSVFAGVNNLLAQKYDIWYGCPAEGIRFMGGLSLKF